MIRMDGGQAFLHQISVQGDFLLAGYVVLSVSRSKSVLYYITRVASRGRGRRRRRIVYVMARLLSTAQQSKQDLKRTSVTEARLQPPSLSLSTDVSAKEGGFDPVHTD